MFILTSVFKYLDSLTEFLKDTLSLAARLDQPEWDQNVEFILFIFGPGDINIENKFVSLVQNLNKIRATFET